jgi:hypothetical protein
VSLPSRSVKKRALSSGAGASSWLGLLASATLGLDGTTVHAEIRSDAGLDDSAEYSLVVQSYDGDGVQSSGRRARPVGSMHRVVTGAELRRGIHLNLVELRDTTREPAPTTLVVAWIEDGKVALDYDARGARPQAGSVYGDVHRTAADGTVQISLHRTLAA